MLKTNSLPPRTDQWVRGHIYVSVCGQVHSIKPSGRRCREDSAMFRAEQWVSMSGPSAQNELLKMNSCVLSESSALIFSELCFAIPHKLAENTSLVLLEISLKFSLSWIAY